MAVLVVTSITKNLGQLIENLHIDNILFLFYLSATKSHTAYIHTYTMPILYEILGAWKNSMHMKAKPAKELAAPISDC